MELRRTYYVSDGIGGYIWKWGGLRNITGVLCDVTGAERLAADKLTVIADLYFYIDYPIGETIIEADRFVIGTKEYNITYIQNLGARQNNRLRITLMPVV